ncbi:glutathione S-transferase [Microbaculum marinisediminis]|uniref:Glutathione S-transferase n=1 Tax=Microbaculum marinisediminis TaxID=2931392 RepID=A0AAW5QZ33_9HYPH|nr:glutathione S-transferase [Microbaculum sp. A6E488]MCT8972280.1 glutathione S-transferase [Microbaculum sp. A6E488]
MADELRIEECVNAVCPWSGDPVRADSLTLYRGRVVGFCNTGCRDKFAKATALFDENIGSDGKIDR